MRYNIALLPKKVTNYVTWLLFMESNVTILHYSLKKLLITLLGYFLWKVMRYNIAFLDFNVTIKCDFDPFYT